MINPFRRTYQIAEHRNLEGQTRFVASYANTLERLFSFIGISIFIGGDGDLYLNQSYSWYNSIEIAKEAIQNHKDNLEQNKRQKHKKTVIHYVN